MSSCGPRSPVRVCLQYFGYGYALEAKRATEYTYTMTMDNRNLVIRLDPADNVGVAARTLHNGEVALCDGRPLTVRGTVPTGHKIAVEAIPARAKVVKFAAPIGSATRPIQPGEHVHLHNLQSDYLPTYTFDDGKTYVRSAADEDDIIQPASE